MSLVILKVTCKDKAEIHEKTYVSWMYFMHEGCTGSRGTVNYKQMYLLGWGVCRKVNTVHRSH